MATVQVAHQAPISSMVIVSQNAQVDTTKPNNNVVNVNNQTVLIVIVQNVFNVSQNIT